MLQSSANLSGEPDARRLLDVPASIRAGADLVLDGGELPGVPSTVLDLREYERRRRVADRARGASEARGRGADPRLLVASSAATATGARGGIDHREAASEHAARLGIRSLSPAEERAMPELSPDYFNRPLAEVDPEVAAALRGELARQHDTLEMIASENFVPRAVLECQGSVLTNKYAEGYPGRATTAAASGSTSPSSSRSTAPRSCSAPSTRTSSRTPARRRTPPSTTRCCSPATRSWGSRSPTAAISRTA